MITEYQQIKDACLHILETSGLTDYFSTEEKQRLIDFFYSGMMEFDEMHPVDSFVDKMSWQSSAETFLNTQLEELDGVFGIKDLAKKLQIDEFLKQVYELENS